VGAVAIRKEIRMPRRLVPLFVGGVLAAGLTLFGAPAHAATVLPNSMGAVGDSVTRAFDVNGSHFLSDAPAESWSTGTDAAVNSEYRRILAANPAIGGHAFNDAVTGAMMAALDGQMKNAAAQHVDYLTVLMGANDVCTSSASTMTPTATFTSQFDLAMRDFTTANPNATVFVSSIPNIYQLWNVLHTSGSARFAWSIYGVCKSMLSSRATETQRQQVLAQEKADNAALASVCARYTACRWDGGAAFAVSFTASQVSTVDYFHPNVAGQALLAATAWKVGPYAL
jgi:lysophospholipase L1-like esterase